MGQGNLKICKELISEGPPTSERNIDKIGLQTAQLLRKQLFF